MQSLSLRRALVLLPNRRWTGTLCTFESLFVNKKQYILPKISHKSDSNCLCTNYNDFSRHLRGNVSFIRPVFRPISSIVNPRLTAILSPQKEDPELDWEYLLNPKNMKEIQSNIASRKGVGDINLVHRYVKMLEELKSNNKETSAEYRSIKKSLLAAANDLPNRTHPSVPIGDETSAMQVALCGNLREFSFEPKSAVELAEELGLLRTQNVGLTTGPRTYYLCGDLARLEEALVNYTLDVLLAKNFSLISVPDLVSSDVINGCGFKATGIRTQIYKLKKDRHGDVCLAGTGEIPIAGYLKNQELKLTDLPKRLCTVSRCYRAETSDIEKERGLYRVHQFTKVEMFVVTGNEAGDDESERLLHEILDIQRSLFNGLRLHFRILNMPSQELGSPAVQKFDMETWLPAKRFWGEISSASNCTDFQSRRLRIKYRDVNGNLKHCHTVNGTACAVPRILISILENYQNQDGSIAIPTLLQPYMDNVKVLKTKFRHGLSPSPEYHFRQLS